MNAKRREALSRALDELHRVADAVSGPEAQCPDIEWLDGAKWALEQVRKVINNPVHER